MKITSNDMESLNDRLTIKLDQIADCICARVKDTLPDHVGGLYGGEWGKLLFLCYYEKYSNHQQIKKMAEDYVERLLDHASLEKLSHTFCNGYAGILYLFEFLKEYDLLNVDMDEAEEELEKYIISWMKYDIHQGNYDFLHGALGVGYYFLKKGKNIQPILELVDFLHETAEKDEHTKRFKWKSIIGENEERGFNIALSHGMASIVLFLSHLIRKDIKNNRTFELLENTINYILSQEIEVDRYGCFFPYQSLENKGNDPIKKSRLAWCYGDLGVAYSIWIAGRVTGKSQWTSKGMEILLYSTQRNDLIGNHVIDAGLCHGTSGIAMIYRRMYLETYLPGFSDATIYWLQQSLEMAKYLDGLAGYKTYRSKWICDDNLLTGIAGIGMMFISHLIHDDQAWDEMVLL